MSERPMMTCPTCAGSGPCDTCGGDGQVPQWLKDPNVVGVINACRTGAAVRRADNRAARRNGK